MSDLFFVVFLGIWIIVNIVGFWYIFDKWINELINEIVLIFLVYR